MKFLILNKSKGFTLIELLVVIAIIGFLSTVILSSINEARIKSRDARRQSDIIQIRNAFLAYAIDNKGAFPPFNWVCLGRGDVACHGGSFSGSSALDNLMSPYMKKFPVDPLAPQPVPGKYGDSYMYNWVGSSLGKPALHFGMESCQITAKTCLGGDASTWAPGTSINTPCNVNCVLPLE